MTRPVKDKVEQLRVVLSELVALYSNPANAADFARHEATLSTMLTKHQLLCTALRCTADEIQRAERRTAAPKKKSDGCANTRPINQQHHTPGKDSNMARKPITNRKARRWILGSVRSRAFPPPVGALAPAPGAGSLEVRRGDTVAVGDDAHCALAPACLWVSSAPGACALAAPKRAMMPRLAADEFVAAIAAQTEGGRLAFARNPSNPTHWSGGASELLTADTGRQHPGHGGGLIHEARSSPAGGPLETPNLPSETSRRKTFQLRLGASRSEARDEINPLDPLSRHNGRLWAIRRA